MPDQTGQNPDPRPLDRRSLLRRGGAAAVVGISAVVVGEMVSAEPASAAAGDPFTLGAVNDSGTGSSTLTAVVDSGPTLEVTNAGQGTPLRLTEATYPSNPPTFTSGDISNYSGTLYFTTPFDTAGDAFPAMVYTEANANQTVPIIPQRALDTRSTAGRANLVSTAGLLNAAGQVLAGKTIEVLLDNYVFLPSAAYCNITAVAPAVAGYAQLFAGGTRPVSSSVNFAAKQTVANFAITGATFNSTTLSSTVSIYCSATTHIILDITAFSVSNLSQVNPPVLAAGSTESFAKRLAAHVKAGKVPSWYRATP